MAQIIQHPAISNQSENKKQTLPIADSSYLEHIEYDPQNLQMTVTMKSGAQYLYFYVYPNIMSGFIEAPSKGEYYAKVVRGQHQATRIINKNVGKASKKKT